MYPTYNSGDLVVAVKQASYSTGDVIVYHPDVDCSRCNVVHRIIDGDKNGWITEGDNNDFVDAFRPTSESVYGKVVQHINLGGAGMILVSTQLWLFLLSIIALALYSLFVWDWWKKNDDDEEEPPAEDKPRKAKKEPRKLGRHRLVKTGSAGTSSIVALLVLTLVASAAPTLALTATTLTHGKKVSCAPSGSLTVSTVASSDNHLSVSGIPAGCVGETLIARTIASSTANAIQSSGTIAGSSLNLTSGSTLTNPSEVTGAQVVIGGFNVAATWNWVNNNQDPIVPPSGTNNYNVAVTYTQPNAQQICANITVSTASTVAIPWNAQLRTTGIPFNGDTNPTHYEFNPNFSYRFVSQTPVNGNFTIEGIGGTSTVVAGTNRTFTVCNYNVPMPSGRQPGVTYTVAPGNGTTYTVPASYYACQTFTVTTSGATQFYVGWDVTIDVTPLANAYAAASGASGGSYKPSTAGHSSVSLGGNLYKISGNGYNTAGIKDGGQQQFTVCWGG